MEEMPSQHSQIEDSTWKMRKKGTTELALLWRLADFFICIFMKPRR